MQNDAWIPATDGATGRDFFYNTVTRVASWTLPQSVQATEAPAGVTPTPPVPFATDSNVWVADEEEVVCAAVVVGDLTTARRGVR